MSCFSSVVIAFVLFAVAGWDASVLPSVVAQSPHAFAPPQRELPVRGMWSRQPAKRWQDALVTGNGTLGAMVFGDPKSERIVLNHERLYEPLLRQPCPVPDIAAALPEVRRLALAGKYKKAYEHSYQAALDAGFPGIQWTDPYHPACGLVIEQEIEGEVRDYWRATDFETGEVSVHWKTDQGSFRRQTFASQADNVIVHRLTAPEGQLLSGRIKLVNQDRRPKKKRSDEKGGGYLEPVVTYSDSTLSYACKYQHANRGYRVVVELTAFGDGAAVGAGSVADENGVVFQASELVALVTIRALEDFDARPDSVDAAVGELSDDLGQVSDNYEELLDRHIKIHGEMFGRVRVDFGGGEDRWLCSEELIAKQKASADTKLQPALLEKMFDMGRYTLISSSGEWPPNLMGIWNGDWRPQWSGDFTLDANVNLQIAGANLGNLPEAVESYSRLINGLEKDWQVNARQLFGCRGVMSGCRTDGRHNLHTHFSEKFPGHLWTAGAQWLVLPMYEHYQTTGDEKFLREKLLSLMGGIAVFYQDFLTEKDHDGKRIFVPSYSPENKPLNTGCPASINATMDIACAKEAITNLMSVAAKHGIELSEAGNCQQLLDELPDYLVNDDGALQEWSWAGLEDRYDHRHVSHLYPVWPGHEINPEDTPDLFAAAKIAAAKKGRGNGSAHGLAHMALIGSRLKNDELVYGNLRFMLSSDYLLPSLFTFHNPGRIYNADMLHSLPAVVMEMLVYSKPGEIELLPALSDQLPKGSINGVCCRNQTVVKDLSWNLNAGEVVAVLNSRIDQPMKIRLRRGMEAVTDRHANSIPIDENGVVTVNLAANQDLKLMIKL